MIHEIHMYELTYTMYVEVHRYLPLLLSSMYVAIYVPVPTKKQKLSIKIKYKKLPNSTSVHYIGSYVEVLAK